MSDKPDVGFDPAKILAEEIIKRVARDWATGKKSLAEMRAKYGWASDEIAMEKIQKAWRMASKIAADERSTIAKEG